MTRDGLPPYFHISPDAALAELGAPAGTDGFQSIAEACRRGRDDLAGRGFQEGGEKRLRPFSTWEITRYLIPVAPAHFRRVLRQNPDLPQGRSETPGGARWFSLDEVLRLRAHFGAEGSKAKEYLPYRPPGLPAKVVAVANFKGGVGKTSTAAHLAMSAALDGYKVLVVDLDSQGSMTSIFGARVEDEWSTVFPLLARHYARHLQVDNQRRIDRGDAPVPLDEMTGEALKVSAQDLIRPTHWPNIDLIGAQLNLYWSEFQIPVWRMQARGWKLWDALVESLEADGVMEAYDLIFLDTPPALGYLTINGLSAADILLVPLGASFLEFELHGAVLRHAPRHVPVDRGGREPCRPRVGAPRDLVRMGRGARRHHPLRRRSAGRDGLADRRLSRLHPLGQPPGLHRADRPGGRGRGGHLRGRLPRLQPRDLHARARHLRRDLGGAEAPALRRLAARREGPRPGRGRVRRPAPFRARNAPLPTGPRPALRLPVSHAKRPLPCRNHFQRHFPFRARNAPGAPPD